MNINSNVFQINTIKTSEEHTNLLANREIAQEEKDSDTSNRDFIMYSRIGSRALRELKNINSLKLFMLIAEEVDKTNNLIVSQAVLGELLGISRQAVGFAMKELEEKQFIFIRKTGNASIYSVNSEVIWKAEATKRKLARFTANVIISDKEQKVLKKIKKDNVKKIILKG